MHPAIAGYGSHRIPYYSAEANVRDITAGVEAITTYLAPRRGRPTCSTPTSGSTGSGPPRSRRCRPPPSATSYSTRPRATTTTQPPPRRPAPGYDLGPGMLWTDRDHGAHVLFIDTTLKDQALGANLDPARPAPGSRRSRSDGGSCAWRLTRACGSAPSHLRRRLREGLRQRLVRACRDMKETGGVHRVGRRAPHLAARRHRQGPDPARDSAGTIDVIASIDATLDPGGSPPSTSTATASTTTRGRSAGATPRPTGSATPSARSPTASRRAALWPHEPATSSTKPPGSRSSWPSTRTPGTCRRSRSGDPNSNRPAIPEEFTIVEGLQVRNALVWLAASVWAPGRPRTRRAALRRRRPRARRDSPRCRTCWKSSGSTSRHWDADPTRRSCCTTPRRWSSSTATAGASPMLSSCRTACRAR